MGVEIKLRKGRGGYRGNKNIAKVLGTFDAAIEKYPKHTFSNLFSVNFLNERKPLEVHPFPSTPYRVLFGMQSTSAANSLQHPLDTF